ncbi:hypothetical protein [Pseudoxanthomonas beigongshangi]|uniref:hypothetical protein n=1 Tax=Pseudoxanthomonas beigongshangi TaxID=2782537 RepID=UPI00193C091C|nr:hypothetical protein [Pseudoxanthomonas beigongshangi]
MEWRDPPPGELFATWTLHFGRYRVASMTKCSCGVQLQLKQHRYQYQWLSGRAASIAQGKRFAERWTRAYLQRHPIDDP